MKSMQFSLLASIAAVYAIFIYKPSEPQREVVSAPVAVEYQTAKTWRCPSCSPEEKYVLKQLQEKTKISDRNALATIMGNIKQESRFISNICEEVLEFLTLVAIGVGMESSSGLPENRYRGLGLFAEKYGCDPSEFKCQTQYMINEPVFQKNLPRFEGAGQSVSQYMIPSYYWMVGESKENAKSMHIST